VDAAKAAGCRAIVQSRWKSVGDIEEDGDIYRLGAAPHSRLFPHCAAVVHHGGAGTTQTASLYGCPSAIVAHIADQYFWADELKRLGVAPGRLDRRTATPEGIARAIRQILGSQPMRARAKALGEQLAAENGVAKAVAIIAAIGETAQVS
jgi:UDP:flavonoid glycosyltransferase YjiC (YdhE family)